MVAVADFYLCCVSRVGIATGKGSRLVLFPLEVGKAWQMAIGRRIGARHGVLAG
jgi:formate-dependent phosphoribosylglycinamide formyltransferase (GAR transformylase)